MGTDAGGLPHKQKVHINIALTLIKMGSLKNDIGNFIYWLLKNVWSGDFLYMKIPMPASGFLDSFKPTFSSEIYI
jgi:hypothetical protein